MNSQTHLLDTSVFSQPLRHEKSRNRNAIERWRRIGDAKLAVCVISEAEVLSGLIRHGSARMMEKYDQTLRGRLPAHPIDTDVAETFAALKARQVRTGNLVGDLDLLIAACARTRGLIVATLNHRDFSRVQGLAWEDWGEEVR